MGMSNVRVKVEQLKEILEVNRDAHKAEFDQAIAGYKDRLQHELGKALNDLSGGIIPALQKIAGLPIPVDQTKDYDRAIQMLEMEVRDEVELDEYTFKELVMDDWSWKPQSLATNSIYTSASH